MHKRIIAILLITVVTLLSSCTYVSTTVEETVSKKNTNKTNSIKVNKKQIDEDIRLSPYYEAADISFGFYCLDNDDEKRLYNAVIEHAADFTNGSKDEDGNYIISSFTVEDCDLSSMEVSKVFFAIELDKPDLFWFAKPYSYVISEDDFTLTLCSYLSYDEYKKAKGQLNSVINSVLKGLEPDMSEIERELYIHDYLVKNCVYKESVSPDENNCYNIYGCLVDQSAVCEGYKSAFQLLLSYCGIKSFGVSGSDDKSDNIDHIWNAVELDGEYYYTDVTWDDAEDMAMYDYFNITEKQLLHSHTIAPLFDEAAGELDSENGAVQSYNLIIPECTAEKYNYYRYFGTVLNNMSENTLADDLAYCAKNNDEYFYIYVDRDLNYTTVYDQLFSDDVFLFNSYIDSANDKLGYKALRNSVSVLKRKWLRAIVVELKYNE